MEMEQKLGKKPKLRDEAASSVEKAANDSSPLKETEPQNQRKEVFEKSD